MIQEWVNLGMWWLQSMLKDWWALCLSLCLVLLVSLVLLLSTNEGLLRQVEGKIGGVLLELGSKKLLDKAGLQKKQIFVGGTTNVIMHYYERNPTNDTTNDTTNSSTSSSCKTILLCHGMTSQSKNMSTLVKLLAEAFPTWRMIAPDCLGHGHDLQRAIQLYQNGQDFEYPSPEQMGHCVMDLLDTLKIDQVYAYGASMGGALVYFLQQKRPELVTHAMLISPAVEAVLDDKFLADWESGRKKHFCWTSRNDVELFMQDLSCPQRKANPIPSFMLQAIWEERQRNEPPGHFKNYFNNLLEHKGKDPDWMGTPIDCAPELPRLVLWPEEDFISNFKKGKAFFQKSHNTQFLPLPDCGHLFHADGKTVLVHAAPYFIDYIQKQELSIEEAKDEL